MLLQIKTETAAAILTHIVAFAGFIVILGTIIFIVFVIVSRQRQNKLFLEQEKMKQDFEKLLLQSQIEVQEATYTALGKELHDNICQLLTSAKWMVNIGKQNADQINEVLNLLDDTLGKAIEETRSLSKVLNKDWLAQFDLLENLESEVKRLNASSKVYIRLTRPEKMNLQPEKQIIIFRIIQEALQNALKHAQPKTIDVELHISKSEHLTVCIKDDGIGFEPTEHHDGQGIINMRKRTELLNGMIKWNKTPNNGCSVEIVIPLLQSD